MLGDTWNMHASGEAINRWYQFVEEGWNIKEEKEKGKGNKEKKEREKEIGEKKERERGKKGSRRFDGWNSLD